MLRNFRPMRGESVVEWSLVLLDEYTRLSAVYVLSDSLSGDPSWFLFRAQAGQFFGFGCGDLGSGLLIRGTVDDIGGENRGELRELRLFLRMVLPATGLILAVFGD